MFLVSVIAIDLDPEKIKCARRNAAIYEVEDRIEFICADFFHVIESGALQADVIFLSPPWGGPQYLTSDTFDTETMIRPCGARRIFDVCRRVTNNIAFFAPRNTSVLQLLELAGEEERVEIEQNFLNLKLKAVTAYYGDLIER